MNPLAGRFFSDPAFAAGASNLAAAFAPPGADEYLAAEKYKGLQTQNSAIADLYAGANGNPDVLGVVGDLFDPTNGWEAMRGKLANDRYATDVGASTSIQNNVLDNDTTRRGLAFNALTNPDGRQAVGDDEVMRALGVDAGGFTGAGPVAPSETQVRGGLISGADLSSDDIYALAMGSTPTEEIVTPGGPRLSFGAVAARDGAEPFVNEGSQAAPTAITFTRAGQRVGGFITPDGFVDSAGQPLTPEEAGSAAEVGKPVGTNADLGITNSNRTDATRIKAAAATTDLIVTDILSLIDSQPGGAGLAGSLQRIGQDFVQTASEFQAAMAENGVDGVVTQDMLAQLQSRTQPGAYNPVFQQIRTYLLTLAYANAEIKNGGNEVSQQALARELEALGQGALGNDESLRAALSVSSQGARIALEKAKILEGGTASAIPTIADVNAGTAANPADDDLFRKYGLEP